MQIHPFQTCQGRGAFSERKGKHSRLIMTSAFEGLAANDTNERRPALCQGNVSAAQDGWKGRLYMEKKKIQKRQPDITMRHFWPTLSDSAEELMNVPAGGSIILVNGSTNTHLNTVLFINLICSKTWMCRRSYQHSLDLFIAVWGTPLCLMLIHPAGL